MNYSSIIYPSMSSSLCSSTCALVENWCNTEARLYEVDFNWTIHNFDFHEAKGGGLKSSLFTATTNDKFGWYLFCRPNGVTDKKDTLGIYLCIANNDKLEKVFVKFTVDILDKQQKMRHTTQSSVLEFSLTSTNWGWDEFLKKDTDFKKILLSTGDKLTIHCNVKFSELKDNNTSFHQCKPKVSENDLYDDLALLFENHEFADVIVSVNGKNYHAHKNILAARSPVFAAMFRHNTKENEQNCIVIEDMNEEVVAEMLRYIYTGKCQNLNKLANELLAAADKYALDRLKIICVEELCKTLSVENVANILVLTDLHGVKELKIEVIKFIVTKFAEVLNTTGWKNVILPNPQLVDEVCKAVARR